MIVRAVHLFCVFPVYAGVILTFITEPVTNFSVPRVCGGDPKTGKQKLKNWKCSPCMRG